MSLFVIVVFALFVRSAYLGYEIRSPQIGAFRSRYTGAELEFAARERSESWREKPLSSVGLVSREDQYISEAVWHVGRRNDAVSVGDMFTAWRENRILEIFYAPVLDTPSYIGPSGFRWPAEQRADIARQAEGEQRFYMSDAEPYPIYVWPKSTFWIAIAVAAGAVMAVCISANRRVQPWT